jgi:hypothetical protein
MRIGIVEHHVEQLRRLQAPAHALVVGALPVDKRLVQFEEKLAKLNQQRAIRIRHAIFES